MKKQLALRARAAWHFGSGPEYCRGCAAIARDCGDSCPYSQHAPLSIEAHACWAAGTACAEASIAGITLPFTHALAAAREVGASGWAASEMLMAIGIGMAEGSTERNASASGPCSEGAQSSGVQGSGRVC